MQYGFLMERKIIFSQNDVLLNGVFNARESNLYKIPYDALSLSLLELLSLQQHQMQLLLKQELCFQLPLLLELFLLEFLLRK